MAVVNELGWLGSSLSEPAGTHVRRSPCGTPFEDSGRATQLPTNLLNEHLGFVLKQRLMWWKTGFKTKPNGREKQGACQT